MPKGMWKVMKTEAEKVRMAETKGRGEKRREKQKARKKKRKEGKETQKDRGKEDSRRIGNLE